MPSRTPRPTMVTTIDIDPPISRFSWRLPMFVGPSFTFVCQYSSSSASLFPLLAYRTPNPNPLYYSHHILSVPEPSFGLTSVCGYLLRDLSPPAAIEAAAPILGGCSPTCFGLIPACSAVCRRDCMVLAYASISSSIHRGERTPRNSRFAACRVHQVAKNFNARLSSNAAVAGQQQSCYPLVRLVSF